MPLERISLRLGWRATIARIRISIDCLSKPWLAASCVVHHNLERGATDDDEHLRDAEDFKGILAPTLNMVLHGHTHKDGLGWLDNRVPVISTGSAALKEESQPKELGNQYQIIRIRPDLFERWTRRYDPDQKRWIGDTRCSPGGDTWHFSKAVSFDSVHGTFSTNKPKFVPPADTPPPFSRGTPGWYRWTNRSALKPHIKS